MDAFASETTVTAKRVAFYAPLKPPTHPSPSGDRQMARLLMAALREAGHRPELASDLKTYLRDPNDTATYEALTAAAKTERTRIDAAWRQAGPPDLWVSYHPYYKSPDLLGPPLCRDHDVPWVTVEASQSARRSVGHWADFQAHALDAVQGAKVNIALTGRDALGLWETDPTAPVAQAAPFIDARPYLAITPAPDTNHLVVVAMMRAGDKVDSFTMLAAALAHLGDVDWRLTVVGDGPARAQVMALFDALPADRIRWAGKQDEAGVRRVLERGAVLAWPGCGEAFGLTYLEAQAAGLPVVAQNTAGVPEVVAHNRSGLLTSAGDIEAYADAIRHILEHHDLRATMGAAAREKVRDEHGLGMMARRLEDILTQSVWGSETNDTGGSVE